MLQRGTVAGMSEVLAWPQAQGVLPEPPEEAVVPFLDAACRAIGRFGWARTTMRDIAREAGVERTTVYRHVGSMSDVYRLVVAHELHKLVAAIPSSIPEETDGPGLVVEMVAAAVEHCLEHPVLTKVLTDEPELISGFLLDGVPSIIERLRELLSPMVGTAIDAGLLARRDPAMVTEWIVRVGLSLLVAPPPGDLRAFLDEMLRPALQP